MEGGTPQQVGLVFTVLGLLVLWAPRAIWIARWRYHAGRTFHYVLEPTGERPEDLGLAGDAVNSVMSELASPRIRRQGLAWHLFEDNGRVVRGMVVYGHPSPDAVASRLAKAVGAAAVRVDRLPLQPQGVAWFAKRDRWEGRQPNDRELPPLWDLAKTLTGLVADHPGMVVSLGMEPARKWELDLVRQWYVVRSGRSDDMEGVGPGRAVKVMVVAWDPDDDSAAQTAVTTVAGSTHRWPFTLLARKVHSMRGWLATAGALTFGWLAVLLKTFLDGRAANPDVFPSAGQVLGSGASVMWGVATLLAVGAAVLSLEVATLPNLGQRWYRQMVSDGLVPVERVWRVSPRLSVLTRMSQGKDREEDVNEQIEGRQRHGVMPYGSQTLLFNSQHVAQVLAFPPVSETRSARTAAVAVPAPPAVLDMSAQTGLARSTHLGADPNGRPVRLLDEDRKTGIFITGDPGSGKALAVDTPIATPSGWTTMGDLCCGDWVYAVDGTPTQVTFVTDPWVASDAFEVTFNSGETIVADGDHRWFVSSRAHRDRHSQTTYKAGGAAAVLTATPGEVRTTSQLAEQVRLADGRANWSVPVADALQPGVSDDHLPLDAYLLGVLLSDGHLVAGAVTVRCGDPQVFDLIGPALPVGVSLVQTDTVTMRLAGAAAPSQRAHGETLVDASLLRSGYASTLDTAHGCEQALLGLVSTVRGGRDYAVVETRDVADVYAAAATRWGLADVHVSPVRFERRGCWAVQVAWLRKPSDTASTAGSFAVGVAAGAVTETDTGVYVRTDKVATMRLLLPDGAAIDPADGRVHGGGRNQSIMHSLLEDVGLSRDLGHDAFIPQRYLLADEKTREMLLRGLMDTDGTASKRGNSCTFNTSRESLVEDAVTLVRSLGMKVSVSLQMSPAGRKRWGVTFCPNRQVFNLDRKRSVLSCLPDGTPAQHPTARRHDITAITAAPPVQVRCISVAHPRRLFLAGRTMVPTHNTYSTLQVFGEDARARIGGGQGVGAARRGGKMSLVWLETKGDGADEAERLLNLSGYRRDGWPDGYLRMDVLATDGFRLDLLGGLPPDVAARRMVNAFRFAFDHGAVGDRASQAMAVAFHLSMLLHGEVAVACGLAPDEPWLHTSLMLMTPAGAHPKKVGFMNALRHVANEALHDAKGVYLSDLNLGFVPSEDDRTASNDLMSDTEVASGLERGPDGSIRSTGVPLTDAFIAWDYYEHAFKGQNFAQVLESPRNKLQAIWDSSRPLWTPDSRRSNVSLRGIVENHAVAIINLGSYRRQRMAADDAKRLGSMVSYLMWEEIKSVSSGWLKQGRSVGLYTDELSMICGHGSGDDVFDEMHNQGRSYGVQMALATQQFAQLPDRTAATALGFGTRIYHTTENIDNATSAATDLNGGDDGAFSARDIRELPVGTAAVRTRVSGAGQPPFTVQMADPFAGMGSDAGVEPPPQLPASGAPSNSANTQQTDGHAGGTHG